jgi:hypothetical protein
MASTTPLSSEDPQKSILEDGIFYAEDPVVGKRVDERITDSPWVSSQTGEHSLFHVFGNISVNAYRLRPVCAFHPQTDGQTENANGTLEQYLRSFANYQQDDWSEWTPMCEFALNQWESATTKMTPFFANKGYHPRFRFEPVPEPQDPQSLDAHRFSQKMEDINNHLRAEMLLSQEAQEVAANRHR